MRERKRPRPRRPVAAPVAPEPARSPRRTFLLAGGVAAIAAATAAAGIVILRSRPNVPQGATIAVAQPTFVGAESCKSCHAQEYDLWQRSDHALAMLPADSTTVRGNFDNAVFTRGGVTSTFFQRDGRYFVHTDGPDGALGEFEIAYTFGVDPLQQYLIPFANGRYQALSVAWDTRPAAAGGQRWFHLYPNEEIGHRDVLHWTGQLQNWNYMCGDCHSTNLQENYVLATDLFAPTWTDVNVACEACHGPGSRHVEWAESGRVTNDAFHGFTFALADTSGSEWVLAEGDSIARRTRPLALRAELESCAPCHARRSTVWGEVQIGRALEQTYRAALLDDPLYHADGQIRDEVYEYGSFLQSRMYQEGVTCSDCHEPHAARLRFDGNALCSQCHLATKYDTPQHHFHPMNTESSQCVSCHMPRQMYMVVDGRRDHGFRIPRPDLSEKLGTPNACNQCHADRTPGWAEDAIAQWVGDNRQQGWHWAEAIDAGRHWKVDAAAQLVRAIQDSGTPAIVRATALSLLPAYVNPASFPAVEASLRDSDCLVRRAAAAALASIDAAQRARLGAPLLDDPFRSVRFDALSSLLDVPRQEFTTAQLVALDRVTQEYRDAQTQLADRVESHLNLGTVDARLGRFDLAEAAYRTALRLQPMFIPAYINLADLYRAQGREDQVIATLQEATKRDPEAAEAYAAMGLSFVRQKRLREAMPLLAKAAELRRDTPRHAYVYGVALAEAGELQRALEVLQDAHVRQPAHRDILAALATYSQDAGDRQAAAVWARKLVAISPGDPGARQLLQSLEASMP